MLIRLRNVTAVSVLAVLAATVSLVAPAPADASHMPAACAKGRVVCIDKTTKTVDWVVNGQLRLTMDARFGSARTPTRDGTFTLYRKSEKHVSRLYGISMPFTLFFDGGQAVHYSADFAKRGYKGASRGCVNTRDRASMKKLFHAARIGDRVHVYSSTPRPYAEYDEGGDRWFD